MFVAVVPPEEAVADLEEFLAPRREAADFRWVPDDQWHLTVAFLASVPDRALDDLLERLCRAASRRTPLQVALTGGGAFPSVSRAKVLWTGLETDHAEELRRMSVGARAAAAKAGVAVDGQRFRAHLTLARTRQPLEASNWVRLLEGYRGPAWSVQELTLIESHLGEGPRKRPRYEPVQSFPLGRPGQRL